MAEEQLEGYPLPYEGGEVQQLLNKVRTEAWNAPVNTEKERAQAMEAELLTKIEETLLRAQGMSKDYNGQEDPVKRKIFGGDDYKDLRDQERFIAIVKDMNDWLDKQHSSNIDDWKEFKKIPTGWIHLDQDGSCIWLLNIPMSYGKDIWAQIAINGTVDTPAGFTKPVLHTSESNNIWQRVHRASGWDEWQNVTITQSQVSNLITTALEGYMPNFDPTVKGHLSFDGNVSLMSNGDSGDLFLMNEDNTGRGDLYLNNIFPNGGGSLVDAIRRIKKIEAFLAQKLGYQP